MATVDALVIGRKTFETVLTFDARPYGEKPVFVLSIQRLIITRIPIILGSGIPLFGPVGRDIKLHHVAARRYPSFVQSEYVVAA